jgi:hypothetical protein
MTRLVGPLLAAFLLIVTVGATHHVWTDVRDTGGHIVSSGLNSITANTESTPTAAGDAGQPAPSTTNSAGSGHMNEATFWQLISETRRAADNDTDEQSHLLEERLSKLPAEEILGFERIRQRLDRLAYTWDIWGAAYVIEDGCSDDCFRDFRGYLIFLGQGPYENALRNPDSLASVVQDAENGDWENADDVAPEAYSSATGNDYPGDDSDLSGGPRGRPWDDSNQEALVRRYPALADRFR